MLQDPVNFRDPNGLMSSRPMREIPRYGNWCGANWCGGQRPSENDGQIGSKLPIDGLDKACRNHDMCYGSDKSKSSCDKEFVKELEAIPPSYDGKDVFRRGAKFYFGR